MDFEELLNECAIKFQEIITDCVEQYSEDDSKFYSYAYFKTKYGFDVKYDFYDGEITIEEVRAVDTPTIKIKNGVLDCYYDKSYVSNSYTKKIRNAEDYNEKDMFKELRNKQRTMTDERKKQIVEFLKSTAEELNTLEYDKERTHQSYNYIQDVYNIYTSHMYDKESAKLKDKQFPWYDSAIEATKWWADYLFSCHKECIDKIYANGRQIEIFKTALVKALTKEINEDLGHMSIIRVSPKFTKPIQYALEQACIDITPDDLYYVAEDGTHSWVTSYAFINFGTRERGRGDVKYMCDLTTEEDIAAVKNKYLEECKPSSGRRSN